MISIVTPSTASTIAAASLDGSVALIGILVLLVLLVQKELFSSLGGRCQALSRALNIAIAPLTIAFALLVFARIAAALR